MFACPNCGEKLRRTPSPPGVFWCCPQCQGRAVTISVLRQSLSRRSVNAIWATTRQDPGTPGRRCPACEKPMIEAPVALENGRPILDFCKRCQLVWFDPSEYELVPPAPPPPKGERTDEDLPLAARERLAIHRARFMAETAAAADPSPDANWKTIPGIFGLPVESQSSSLERVPWLTWSLATLIAFISLLAFHDLRAWVEDFGFVPAEAGRYLGLTFLTSFFLHGGLIHLLGNLYFLVIFGAKVEDFVGLKRCGLLILTSTVAGDLLHLAFQPASTVPAIGASGGISGLLAFYALRFPHARLSLLCRGFCTSAVFQWIQLPAWLLFGFWFLLQVWVSVNQVSGFSHTAGLAHLGGGLVGLAIGLKYRAIPLGKTGYNT